MNLVPPQDIGAYLKKLRKEARLSLTDLERGLPIRRATICEIEQGKYVPCYGTVYEIVSFIKTKQNKNENQN
jgi:cytoskeletal protein RodZ